MTTTTITADWQALSTMLAAVKPFAGRDNLTPILTHVKLSTARGADGVQYLTGTTTDRFRAIVYRVPVEYDGPDGVSVSVNVKDMEAAVKAVKTTGSLPVTVFIIDGDSVTVSNETGRVTVASPPNSSYPDVSRLIRGALDAGPLDGGDVVLNPNYLRDLPRARKGDDARVTAYGEGGAGKPVGWVTERYVAVIAKVRVPDDHDPAAGWDSVI